MDRIAWTITWSLVLLPALAAADPVGTWELTGKYSNDRETAATLIIGGSEGDWEVTRTGRLTSRAFRNEDAFTWNSSVAEMASGRLVVTYTLTYNPKSWIFRSEVKLGGRVPDGATIGNGIELQDVYELGDFDLLPFTVPAP